MKYKRFKVLKATIGSIALLTALSSPVFALGPPTLEDGRIGSQTLQDNQDIINAQGVGAVVKFMDKGAVSDCDANGENCRSLFGSDDSFDFTTSTHNSKTSLGGNSIMYMGMGEEFNNVASQVGSLALNCNDRRHHIVAGVAFKANSCSVSGNGSASVNFQICTAPMRGLGVEAPDNAVSCSPNPNDHNFTAPPGKICKKPTCDGSPVGSVNGWSAPRTVTWKASMPQGSSEQEIKDNGLSLVIYPSPDVISFQADSESLTAVNISETAVNPVSGETAVGLHIAYRHKFELTKEMMQDGASAVPNPKDHTSQWDTIEKLSVNKELSKQEANFAASSAHCLQQLHNGIISANEVKVCNESFDNGSGLTPIATSAKVANPDGYCGTVTQCMEGMWKENTTTWEHICESEVGADLKTCNTTTAYDFEDRFSYRERTHASCVETRSVSNKSCSYSASATCWDVTPPSYKDEDGETVYPPTEYSCSYSTSNNCGKYQ